MPLFLVPSSSVVDVFPGVNDLAKGVTHSTRIRTCSSNVVWKTLSLPIRSSLWSACYAFVTEYLQVNGVEAPPRCDPKRGQREGARLLALCLSQISRWSDASIKDDLATNNCDLARFLESAVDLDVLGLRVRPQVRVESMACLRSLSPDFSKNLAESTATDQSADSPGRVRSSSAHATAGESEEIIGSSRLSESDFPSLNSSRPRSLSSACARRVARCIATALARVCFGSSSPAVSAAVAHVHASTLHGACPTSWSETVMVQGPTDRKRVKGGFSVQPKICVLSQSWRQGKFSACRRCTGAGCRFNSPKATSHRYQAGQGRCGHTFLHPGIQFVSPGYGLDIRQSMGWTKVCGTAHSGIWVLKGNARTCMFPANLDHLRVESVKRGSYKTAWVTPGRDCLCSFKYGHGAAVRPQTNDAIWDGVIGLWSRVAPFLSPWCGEMDVPTGVNLNQYAGPGSFIRWA